MARDYPGARWRAKGDPADERSCRTYFAVLRSSTEKKIKQQAAEPSRRGRIAARHAEQIVACVECLAMLALVMTSAGAYAESLADLKGTWSGTFKTAILGNNAHHPGSETVADPPRIRQIEFTFDIEGQDGRLVWCKSWSNPERKEPFVGTMTADGKMLLGADSDGSIEADIGSAELMDLCYRQTGLGPSQAIVASCGQLKRSK